MGFVSPHADHRGKDKTYLHAWKSILASRRSHAIVLVAPDVDALCAVRTLTRLFTQDDISYRIIPVSGYPGLEQIRDELASYGEDSKKL